MPKLSKLKVSTRNITQPIAQLVTSLSACSGLSIKIEVASGLDRVTDCINKGLLVPFSGGGEGSKRVPRQKILKFQSPKNAIFSVQGTKFEDKRPCFFIQDWCSFQFISHTINSYEQWTNDEN